MAMSMARTICARNFGSQINYLRLTAPQLQAARTVTMRVVNKEADRPETFDERNERLKRPLSPHLTIYKPQITSMLSITHRFTGMALAFYATGLGVGALVGDFSSFVNFVESLQLSAPTLFAAKLVLAYPGAYHVTNGVRHLMWDLGKFLTNSEVKTTGWAMLGVSGVLAVVFAAL